MHRPLRRADVAPAVALVGLLGTACGGGAVDDAPSGGDPSASGEVVVFAAASLTEAFTELGDAFEAEHPGVDVTFNFAASSELVAQILEGAPADVFAAADSTTMSRLTEAEGTASDPVVFAGNRSEIIVETGNPLGITDVTDLADDDLVLVTCAPQVPCGAYAAQIFDRAGISPTPDSYEENVKAVVTKVVLGEADAGIAYATDAAAAGSSVTGVEIPAALNVVAEYPIAVTAEATNAGGGRTFVEFVLGEAGQQVLTDAGFSSP